MKNDLKTNEHFRINESRAYSNGTRHKHKPKSHADEKWMRVHHCVTHLAIIYNNDANAHR